VKGAGVTTHAEPFRVTVQDGVVLVDGFDPEIRRYYLDLERELPVVRDAVARLVEEGHTRFLFDLRTADPTSAYPIAKWGAMYGALFALRRRQPVSAAAPLAKNIKLVASGGLLGEIKLYGFDQIFECFATAEEAKDAFRQQGPG
jgi:hypothetical protein